MAERQSVSERTRQELERGRIIAGRAKRESDLMRYVQGKAVRTETIGMDHQVQTFYVAGVKVAEQNLIEDDYPSEAVMAMIAMAVAATVGTAGIPSAQTIDPETRDRRNQYRDRYLGHWRDK